MKQRSFYRFTHWISCSIEHSARADNIHRVYTQLAGPNGSRVLGDAVRAPFGTGVVTPCACRA
eukprot:2480317-Lingulodinium_polyedra.AAC.1